MDKEISYSDGEVELEILQALKDSKDVSSDASIAIEKQLVSWPFEYHLGRSRANIVRHIDFRGKRVLEIGAGMGAISRFVAEQCDYLQVVEGTSRRLECLNERLRDLSNYSVYCGNFAYFECEEKFDVILVIGVLEYAELYLQVDKGQNPFVEFLKKSKELLAPGGTVVVAIENRLGIKYWAGATEDHTGNLFDGILGYSVGPSVRTFSKKEMASLFEEAGLMLQLTQYPFPDYKMPKSIILEELEYTHSKLFSEIASGSIARDYSHGRLVLFSDSAAMRSLEGTGLMGEFANSFLFFGSSGHASLPVAKDIVAYNYSVGRRLNTITTFTKVADGLRVDKRMLNVILPEFNFGEITWRMPDSCMYTYGELLSSHLQRLLTFREWERFEKEISLYLKTIFLKYCVDGAFLRGEAWDMLPQNIILDQDRKYVEVDQEWVFNSKFSGSWLVLRCIMSFDENIRAILIERYHSLREFYSYLCSIVKIDGVIERDIALEVSTQLKISGVDGSELTASSIKSILDVFDNTEILYSAEGRTQVRSIISSHSYLVKRSAMMADLEARNRNLQIQNDRFRKTLPFRLYKIAKKFFNVASGLRIFS